MAEKDKWDKVEIVTKFLATVILASIPLVIKMGADNIAQSLEKGRLIQSLLSDLSQKEEKTKRDIALVALDAAIPPLHQCSMPWLRKCSTDYKSDQVINVASLLLRDITAENWETQSSTAIDIIKRRSSDEFYAKEAAAISQTYQQSAISLPEANTQNKTEQSQQEANASINVSKALAIIQPDTPTAQQNKGLAGIKLVFIQYGSNKQRAQAMQQYLQKNGINAPGIEQVAGIQKNDIRYANEADKQTAQELSNLINQQNNVQIESLVDLSARGYKIAPGQFEIWLKE